MGYSRYVALLGALVILAFSSTTYLQELEPRPDVSTSVPPVPVVIEPHPIPLTNDNDNDGENMTSIGPFVLVDATRGDEGVSRGVHELRPRVLPGPSVDANAPPVSVMTEPLPSSVTNGDDDDGTLGSSVLVVAPRDALEPPSPSIVFAEPTAVETSSDRYKVVLKNQEEILAEEKSLEAAIVELNKKRKLNAEALDLLRDEAVDEVLVQFGPGQAKIIKDFAKQGAKAGQSLTDNLVRTLALLVDKVEGDKQKV